MEKEIVQSLCESFFSKLMINTTSLEVEESSESHFYIKIKTDDSGIIIGPHGKNLEAIKMILRMMISKKIDKNAYIEIEINDYLESKESKLFKYIDGKISLAKKLKKDIKLSGFSGYERKLIHGYVSGLTKENVYTKSMGEGVERCLYICLKDEKITIDIDGDDI